MAAKPDKRQLDDVLGESAAAVGAPVPSKLGVTAAVFERWLLGRLLANLGFALFPLGLLTAHDLVADQLAVIGIGMAGSVAALAPIALRKRLSAKVASHRVGAAFASLWIAASYLGGVAGNVLSLAIAALLTTLVSLRRVHPRATVLFVLFASSTLALRIDDDAYRAATVVATGALFVILARQGAQPLATLMAWALAFQSWTCFFVRESWAANLAVVIALLISLEVQLRRKLPSISSLRRLLDAAPFAAVAPVAVFLLDREASFSRIVWCWAAAVVACEAVAAARQRALRVERVATSVLAVDMAMVLSSNDWPWHVPLFALLLSAIVLQLHASWTREALASQIGALLALTAASWLVLIIWRAEQDAIGLLLGALSSMTLLQIATQAPLESELPWWRGIIGVRYALLLRGYTLKFADAVSKLRALSLILSWCAVPLVWIRYLRARLFPPQVNSLMYVAGHALAVWLLTVNGARSLSVLCGGDASGAAKQMFAAVLGCAYGAVLGVASARSALPYGRITGVCCVAFPAVRLFMTPGALDLRVVSAVLLATGAALATMPLTQRFAAGETSRPAR